MHFVGTWTARGAIQLKPDAQQEQMRCRIVFVAEGPTRIVTSGRCATSSETRNVTGELACKGADHVGTLFFVAGETPPVFIRDMSDGDQVSLLLQAIDPDTGQPERYRLNAASKTSATMELRATKGAWTPLSLRLSRTPE